MRIDDNGDIYICGSYSGTVDFDPGASTFFMTSSVPNSYLLKLNSNGDFIWAKGFDYATINDLEIDANGHLFCVGSFGSPVDFDPGAGTNTISSIGSNDCFLLKLNSSGIFTWVKTFGGANLDIAQSITIDNNNQINITGAFQGTSDFDPSNGTLSLTSNGSRDIFVAQFDTDGFIIWAKSFGGTGLDSPSTIIVDSENNLYITGYFSGTIDIDMGPDVYQVTSNGGTDIFVTIIDNNGGYRWSETMGDASNDFGYDLAIGSDNSLYTTGYFTGTVDFDPDVSIYNVTGTSDTYVQKLSISSLLTITKNNFEIKKINRNIILTWEESSKDIESYILEKSIDGKNWREVTEIHKSSEMHFFSYTDLSLLPGLIYYRLNRIYENGLVYDKSILKINMNYDNLTLYPNPSSKNISFSNIDNNIYTIIIYNLSGQLVYSETLDVTDNELTIDLEFLNSGYYFLQLTDYQTKEISFHKFQKK